MTSRTKTFKALDEMLYNGEEFSKEYFEGYIQVIMENVEYLYDMKNDNRYHPETVVFRTLHYIADEQLDFEHGKKYRSTISQLREWITETTGNEYQEALADLVEWIKKERNQK